MKYAIFPIGGKGQRFEIAGYVTPKPFIRVMGRGQLEWSILSCRKNYPEAQIVIGCRDGLYEECQELVQQLYKRLNIKIIVFKVGLATSGAAHTVQIVLNSIIDDGGDFDFLVLDNDVALMLGVKQKFQNCHAGLVITKSSNPAHSFVLTDNNHIVSRIVEKTVISDQGVVGNYYFGSKKTFQENYEKLPSSLEEKYISYVIQKMLESGAVIRAEESTKVVSFGTPEEIAELKPNSLSFLAEEK